MQILKAILTLEASSWVSTLEQDQLQLDHGVASVRARLALQYRVQQKQVLLACLTSLASRMDLAL